MTFNKIAAAAVLASMTAMPLSALDLNVNADAGVSAGTEDSSTALALGTGVGAELGTDEGTLSADASIGADVEAGTDGLLDTDGETMLAADTAATADIVSEDGDLSLAVAGGSVLSSDELNLGTVSDISVGIDGSDSLMVAVNSDLGLNVEQVSITDDNFTVLADGSVMIDMTQDEFMAAVNGSATATN